MQEHPHPPTNKSTDLSVTITDSALTRTAVSPPLSKAIPSFIPWISPLQPSQGIASCHLPCCAAGLTPLLGHSFYYPQTPCPPILYFQRELSTESPPIYVISWIFTTYLKCDMANTDFFFNFVLPFCSFTVLFISVNGTTIKPVMQTKKFRSHP